MGRGIFSKLLKDIEEAGERVSDTRRQGFDLKYKMKDALKCALSVFFFQHPSMLDFQRMMKQKRKRSNLETMMGVREIPSNVQITTLLDNINPDTISGVFNDHLHRIEEWDVLKAFRVLDDGVLLALDGVQYFSSNKISCEHCQHKTKGDITSYSHSVLAGTLVKPGNMQVIPIAPEMIHNSDGEEKQDCEINAAKRWLEKHADDYAWLTPTLLGDDLFSHYPFCKAVLDKGYSFIFTCKDESHPWITETVKHSFLTEYSQTTWNGRRIHAHHLTYTYRWINGVEIRDDKEYKELTAWAASQ